MSRPDFVEIARAWLVRATGRARPSEEQSLANELERVYGLGAEHIVAGVFEPSGTGDEWFIRAGQDLKPFFAVREERGLESYSNLLPDDVRGLEARLRDVVHNELVRHLAGAPLRLVPPDPEPPWLSLALLIRAGDAGGARVRVMGTGEIGRVIRTPDGRVLVGFGETDEEQARTAHAYRVEDLGLVDGGRTFACTNCRDGTVQFTRGVCATCGKKSPRPFP